MAGHNVLRMKDLAGLFEAAGCTRVRTYIQSGNVVFQADRAVASRLPERIAARIAEQHGYRTTAVLRTREELARVCGNNPFAGGDDKFFHVVFLPGEPAAAKVAALDPDRSPPDQFAVRGREIYLQLPAGVGHSKLTPAYFDSRLGMTGMARNWRTVERLHAMASE